MTKFLKIMAAQGLRTDPPVGMYSYERPSLVTVSVQEDGSGDPYTFASIYNHDHNQMSYSTKRQIVVEMDESWDIQFNNIMREATTGVVKEGGEYKEPPTQEQLGFPEEDPIFEKEEDPYGIYKPLDTDIKPVGCLMAHFVPNEPFLNVIRKYIRPLFPWKLRTTYYRLGGYLLA